jgi:hypothetical protein
MLMRHDDHHHVYDDYKMMLGQRKQGTYSTEILSQIYPSIHQITYPKSWDFNKYNISASNGVPVQVVPAVLVLVLLRVKLRLF